MDTPEASVVPASEAQPSAAPETQPEHSVQVLTFSGKNGLKDDEDGPRGVIVKSTRQACPLFELYFTGTAEQAKAVAQALIPLGNPAARVGLVPWRV